MIRGTSPVRRRILRGGLAAGSLFLPVPWAWVWAQSEGAAKLLRAPKLALVMGNSAYRGVPALKNPGNDSRAVAEALRAAHFDVALVQDATRERMEEAIGAHARALAARKAVGLVYYAGHGLQMQWRNYLLPVDAAVVKAADVPARCVDVTTLMEALRKAGNPMNVIILDACRDNPFGAEVQPDRRGLSQADAPTGSFLAYATAPGNTADDGEGAHGLYTEHLLREIRVREARIEDVFKRVRLGVRKASGGRQVPWESTSLEEDFYFFPPEQLRRLSQEEQEREFREELAAYERVADSRDASALEGFLRRHPSGRFAELAQLRLDAALAATGEKPVRVPSARGNLHTAGTERMDTAYAVGDRYLYMMLDRLKGGVIPFGREQVVTAVTENEVIFNDGRMVLDRLGNVVVNFDGKRFTPRQDKPLEFAVGRRWTTRYGVTRNGVDTGWAETDFRVVARERIKVPAGTFDAFRVEASRFVGNDDGSTREGTVTYWMQPSRVRRVIIQEEKVWEVTAGRRRVLIDRRIELNRFQQR